MAARAIKIACLARGLAVLRKSLSMNLTINGEKRILASAETLATLVGELGMKSDRVAIELNREIVPREQWPQTPLKDGDQLEIVQFVGGGLSASADQMSGENR